MPTPERTTLDDIVRAGVDILESEGLVGLTMQAVAERVGVRAPSLYKRVRNRDDLVTLVAEATVADLGARLDAVWSEGDDGSTDVLVDLAQAMRGFAHDRPAGYRLIFAPAFEASRPSIESLARAVGPVLHVTTLLVGERNALNAARTLTAWANGFITMELAGVFNLGGDVDEAFEYGVERLAAALG